MKARSTGAQPWFPDNSGSHGQRVRQKSPIPWGLYDMAGNAWEWCWDWYASSYNPADLDEPKGPSAGERRVLRGGSFYHVPRDLRSADRSWFNPEASDENIWFRCMRGSVRQLVR